MEYVLYNAIYSVCRHDGPFVIPKDVYLTSNNYIYLKCENTRWPGTLEQLFQT